MKTAAHNALAHTLSDATDTSLSYCCTLSPGFTYTSSNSTSAMPSPMSVSWNGLTAATGVEWCNKRALRLTGVCTAQLRRIMLFMPAGRVRQRASMVLGVVSWPRGYKAHRNTHGMALRPSRLFGKVIRAWSRSTAFVLLSLH